MEYRKVGGSFEKRAELRRPFAVFYSMLDNNIITFVNAATDGLNQKITRKLKL